MKKILEKFNYLAYFVLLSIPMVVLRDFSPRNELKYLSISKEMIKNGSIFILKNHGENYADKPPLYFWLINIVNKILPNHSYFAIILYSLIPSFLIILLMNKWLKKYLNKQELLIGSLMLMTTAIYLGTSVILRMDMLMTLFIVLAVYSFFNIYSSEKGRSKKIYLIYLYIFLALFTKGPMGVIIPILSFIVFAILEKDKNLFKKIKFLKGFLLLITTAIIWFILVWKEGGNDYLYQLTFKQTVNRSINAFTHARPWYYYFKTMISTFTPWTLFYFYGIFNSIKNYKSLGLVEKYFLVIITSTIIFLSSVSGKLDIYLLPIYPFLPFLSLMRLKKSKNKRKVLLISLTPFILILSLTSFIGLFFIKKEISVFMHSYILLIMSGIVFGMAIANIYFEKYSKMAKYVYLGFFFIVSFAVINIKEINKISGLKEVSKCIKKEINNDNKDYQIYVYKKNKYMNIDFYLNKKVFLLESLDELSKINKPFIILGNIKELKKDFESKNKKVNIVYETKQYFLIKSI